MRWHLVLLMSIIVSFMLVGAFPSLVSISQKFYIKQATEKKRRGLEDAPEPVHEI